MNIVIRVFIPICCFLLCNVPVKAALVINEIMQSNVKTLFDDIHEYPDSWVELYNPSDDPEELKSYSICDRPVAFLSFRPGNLTVEPHGYVVIYCDKVNQGLHANFRLDSGKGGNLYLFKNNIIVDKLESIPKMLAPDIAYGRITDGAEEWGFQMKPTPDESNCGEVTDKILGNPLFSVSGQILEEPLDLTISLPKNSPENAKIYYTTDGSEPTLDKTPYSCPIEIKENTVVRAKVYAEGYLSPTATTHSYIFHGRELTLPIVSLAADDDDLYGVEGILSDFTGEPGISNFWQDWRRPVNIEYFIQSEEEAVINQLGETRLKGHGSRNFNIKSMVLYANKRFGTKRLDYEFFPDQKPGLSDFKSLELRNAGNDYNYVYMRDAVIQRSMGEYADIDWAASQPVVVYVNGSYHGILNLRERANEDYIYTNYDGLENIDVIENWLKATEGFYDAFEMFRHFYSQEGHSFEEFEAQMDIEEFINYFIMNVYFCNTDFPANNCIAWKEQDDEAVWRWIAKDTDYGLGLYDMPYDFPIFDWYYYPSLFGEESGNAEWATKLFLQLLKYPAFKDRFLDKFLIYMGDFLNPSHVNSLIDYMRELVRYEFPRHAEKNIPDYFSNLYDHNIESMKEWEKGRHSFMYTHITEFFEKPATIPFSIDADSDESETLAINDVTLTGNKFEGQYFSETPLKISLKTNVEKELYWTCIVYMNNEAPRSYRFEGEEVVLTLPKEAESVSLILGADSHDSGVLTSEEMNGNIDWNHPYEIYDLQGRKIINDNVRSLAKGIYIIKQRNKTFKYGI